MSPKPQRFEPRQHMNTTTFEVFRYGDSGARDTGPHHHDFYEIYYFLSGNVRYCVGGEVWPLSTGDILLIPPLAQHHPVIAADAKSCERFVIWINPKFLDSLGPANCDFSRCFTPGRAGLLHAQASNLLTFQLEQLLLESKTQDPYGPIIAASYLIQIFTTLNRQFLRQQQERKEPWTPPDSVVYYVTDFINDHYSEDLSLDELANRFFTSKYHLSREFQRITGTSVHRYLVQKRLESARQLMARGIPISQVCQRCGFGDYSNFFRAFRREFGLSPKEFIAQSKRQSLLVSDK